MRYAEIIDRYGRRRKRRPGDDTPLEDGETLVVPMRCMDGTMREAGFDRNGNCVGPVATFDATAHRPGYRLADTTTAERSAGARAVALHQLSNAWRSPAATADAATRISNAWSS
jgi:hypothetical protein